MNTKNNDHEILVGIINKKALPFCDEVYELANEILKHFKRINRCEHCNSVSKDNRKYLNLCDKCIDLLGSGSANMLNPQRDILSAFVKDWYKDNPFVSEDKQLLMVDKFLNAYRG